MRNGLLAVLGLVLIGAGFALGVALEQPVPATAPADWPELGLWEGERDDGGYYTIVDERGTVLDKTARHVYVGDEFIAEDNSQYRVTRVSGDRAEARRVGRAAMPAPAAGLSGDALPVQRGSNKVAIYHTHSAESYVPTDGTESIPARGGIFKVGQALATKLDRDGLRAIHDTTPHEPRDANAYKRSRRTALRLLQQGPAMLIDVHRDGVPDPNFYNDVVSGEPVTKIRLVVGRQNANMQANLDFAKLVKGEVDKKYPGLVRGIFLGRGNYNQDLSPRALLIEAGTHTNDRLRAQRGVSLFADAVPPTLVAAGVAPGAANRTPGLRGDFGGALWIVVALLVGAGAYLLIATGSWEGAAGKLRQFAGREWGNFLAPVRKPGRGRQREEEAAEKLAGTNDNRTDWQKD
ncbi:MAG: stage II sporulation protein P [Armatimonadota bacterium]|nr:stage II sporulation protein P [Armatimonadota bacterium]